jgi:hypothetical protein
VNANEHEAATWGAQHDLKLINALPPNLLLPVHNLIFITHCTNLPILPASQPALPECAGQEIQVPVVPLCIPAPEVFPQLSTFLYTKRIDHLLGSLLPCPSLPQLYLDDPTTVISFMFFMTTGNYLYSTV